MEGTSPVGRTITSPGLPRMSKRYNQRSRPANLPGCPSPRCTERKRNTTLGRESGRTLTADFTRYSTIVDDLISFASIDERTRGTSKSGPGQSGDSMTAGTREAPPATGSACPAQRPDAAPREPSGTVSAGRPAAWPARATLPSGIDQVAPVVNNIPIRHDRGPPAWHHERGRTGGTRLDNQDGLDVSRKPVPELGDVSRRRHRPGPVLSSGCALCSLTA